MLYENIDPWNIFYGTALKALRTVPQINTEGQMNKRLLGMILAGGLWTGCGPDSALDLLFLVDILVATNNPDDFAIAGVSTSYSGTRTYHWSCSKGQANLTVGGEVLNGSIRVEAFDGAGNLVHDNRYEAHIIGGIDVVTKSGGAPGSWTLRFTFDDALFTGAITLRADTLNEPDRIDIGGIGALDVSWIFEPGWDTDPVDISIGGMSGGSVRVRVWDGAGALVYDQTSAGVSTVTGNPSGAAGVWLVQIDFNSAVSVGAVTLSQP